MSDRHEMRLQIDEPLTPRRAFRRDLRTHLAREMTPVSRSPGLWASAGIAFVCGVVLLAVAATGIPV